MIKQKYVIAHVSKNIWTQDNKKKTLVYIYLKYFKTII